MGSIRTDRPRPVRSAARRLPSTRIPAATGTSCPRGARPSAQRTPTRSTCRLHQLLDDLLEHRAGDGADLLLHHLPALEEEQGGDALDAETRGEVGLLINVDLRDLEAV